MSKVIGMFHGLDPFWFSAQMHQESQHNPYAVSSAGAQGIAQFMPGTARAVGLENPFDPIAAMNAAAAMEARDINTYVAQGYTLEEAKRLTLCAYNAGKGRVAQYGGCPPYTETQNYHRVITLTADRDRRRFNQRVVNLASGRF